MSAPREDRQTRDENTAELLGAYALNACEPEEVAAVEELLARRPELASEAARLSRAAAWIGATEAMEAPVALKSSLFDAAHARRSAVANDVPAHCYRASAARLEDAIRALETDDFERPTPNGLTARDLVVHLAAQDSLVAAAVGASPIPDVDERDIDARTALLVERFGDRPLDEVHDLWRSSVDAVMAWADDPQSHEMSIPLDGYPYPRDNALLARSFENWIHCGDLREAQGRDRQVPPVDELSAMSNLSMTSMPIALLVAGHSSPGKVARVVLTGSGGGDWLIAMGGEHEIDREPDVTLTTDVVDWCLLVGERIDPDELVREVDGDTSLIDDLLVSASAFATL